MKGTTPSKPHSKASAPKTRHGFGDLEQRDASARAKHSRHLIEGRREVGEVA